MATTLQLADPPARDSRFTVVERWVELANFPTGHPQRRVEFFHRQMNEEIDSLECAAQNLSDFREAEWSLRLSLARQCFDEARHARMFRRHCEAAGGRIGEFPVICFQYRIVVGLKDLIGRLAVQNRSFEAGGIDAIAAEINDARRRGDERETELFEAQLADEISHVRFANEMINAAIKADPRNILRIGTALTQSSEAFGMLMGEAATAGATSPADRASRLEAGFAADEVDLAVAVAERIRAEDAARSAAWPG
jgi:uncharacterized ferritin-like protein (DUF455 family)